MISSPSSGNRREEHSVMLASGRMDAGGNPSFTFISEIAWLAEAAVTVPSKVIRTFH